MRTNMRTAKKETQILWAGAVKDDNHKCKKKFLCNVCQF